MKMSSKYFTVDWGEFHSQNILIYLIVMMVGYFAVKQIPSTLPIFMIMMFVGGAILAKQILNARKESNNKK